MRSETSVRWRAVLAAPREAFAAKAILIMVMAQILAWAVYEFFFFGAHLLAGSSLSTVWEVFGLLPSTNPALHDPLAVAALVLGMALAVVILMIGFLAVSSFEVLRQRGEYLVPLKRALVFAAHRLRPLLLTEFAILAFLAFVALLFAVAGLIGRIPVLGELAYSVFAIFPVYFISVLVVFVILVQVASILILPSVLAWQKGREVFQPLLETFTVLVRRPLGWGAYTAYGAVAGKVCAFVYAWISFQALRLTSGAFGLTDGGTFETLVRGALSHLPVDSTFFKAVTQLAFGLSLHSDITSLALTGSGDLAELLMAVMLWFILLSISGYFFSVVATVQAAGFRAIEFGLLQPATPDHGSGLSGHIDNEDSSA